MIFPSQARTRKPFTWPQFSLWSLMMVMTVLSLGLAASVVSPFFGGLYFLVMMPAWFRALAEGWYCRKDDNRLAWKVVTDELVVSVGAIGLILLGSILAGLILTFALLPYDETMFPFAFLMMAAFYFSGLKFIWPGPIA